MDPCQHKKLSLTIVFDSNELIRSPDDDPRGLKHIVLIKTNKHTSALLILSIVVLTENLYSIRNIQQDAKHKDKTSLLDMNR
jgi:hypothetical protein